VLRSLFHRTMKTPDPKCANATVRDRPAPSATSRSIRGLRANVARSRPVTASATRSASAKLRYLTVPIGQGSPDRAP
jgi:hypothetical protein